MSLNTITQVKLPDGNVIELVDWSDLPIYSSLDLQTGFTAQEMSLFQYTVGNSVPGFGTGVTTSRVATERDTNVQAPGSMASTEEMLVYAIKPEISFWLADPANDFTSLIYSDVSVPFGFPQPTAEGLAILANLLLVELEISQKRYAYASLGYFNTGFGVFGRSNNANQEAGLFFQSAGNLGWPSQNAVRSFVIPGHMGSQEKYRVNITNPSSLENGAVNFGLVVADGEPATYELNAAVACTIKINLDGLYKRPVS
jgi:hypothetical protein